MIWGMSPAERTGSPAVAGETTTEAATNSSAATTSINLYIGSLLSNNRTHRAESLDRTLSRALLPDDLTVLTCPFKSLTRLRLHIEQAPCLNTMGWSFMFGPSGLEGHVARRPGQMRGKT